jgi:2-polyprenyl-3-methyl-5-hydroxy-6-metoxy-1,4-benzoquinol methylase
MVLYDSLARYYDLMESNKQEVHAALNSFLQRIFKEHNTKMILDVSCGTGNQSIPLARQGFDVTASDISSEMLAQAEIKAKGIPVRFRTGDMRTDHYGQFDAIISMINSVGYVPQEDIGRTFANVAQNLKQGGLFIFDIPNHDFLKDNVITEYPLIDCAVESDRTKCIRFSRSDLDPKSRILTLHWTIYVQKGMERLETMKKTIRIQTYSAPEITRLLGAAGFSVKGFYDRSGSEFNRTKSLTLLTIAKRLPKRV